MTLEAVKGRPKNRRSLLLNTILAFKGSLKRLADGLQNVSDF